MLKSDSPLETIWFYALVLFHYSWPFLLGAGIITAIILAIKKRYRPASIVLGILVALGIVSQILSRAI